MFDPVYLSVVAGLSIFILANMAFANVLYQEQKKIKEIWHEILDAFFLKTDLVPLLVTTFRDYKKFNPNSLKALVETKNKSYKTGKIKEKYEVERILDGFIEQIIKEGKNTPKLRVDIDFLEIGTLLKERKKGIRDLMIKYNETAEKYNKNVKSFYSLLIRPFLGWRGVNKLPKY